MQIRSALGEKCLKIINIALLFLWNGFKIVELMLRDTEYTSGFSLSSLVTLETLDLLQKLFTFQYTLCIRTKVFILNLKCIYLLHISCFQQIIQRSIDL